MAKSKPWTQAECDACIKAYNVMLTGETVGAAVNKAAINRYLRGDETGAQPSEQQAMHIEQGALSDRSRGSIELKCMNISAARKSLDLPTISGYKPLPNMQALLKNRVRDLSQ
jgi:hypothetical protein